EHNSKNYKDTPLFYLVLPALATESLAGNPDDVTLNFLPGQGDPVVTIPGAPRFPFYNLRGPEIFEPLPVAEKQTELRIKQATVPGNYTIEGVDSTPAASRLSTSTLHL